MGIYYPGQSVLQMTSFQRLFGQTVINTYYYRPVTFTDPAKFALNTPDDLTQGVADALFTSVGSQIVSQLSLDLTTERVRLQMVAPTRSMYLDFVPGEGTVGGSSAHSLPPTNAVILRRRSQMNGRFAAGRIFIAGIPLDMQSGGAIKDTLRDALNGIGENFTINIDDTVTQWENVLWHPGRDETSPNIRIWDWFTDPTLRVQRRRELQVGI